MFESVFAAITVIALSIGSAALYGRDHRSKDYREGRPGTIESPRLFHAFYRYLQVSTLVVGVGSLLSSHPLWLVVFRSAPTVWAGTALAIGGFALFASAKRTLGRHYSPCYDAYLPTTIVRHGVYRVIRHPIYTANIATLTGLAIATGSVWMIANAVTLTLYYHVSARCEEDALRRTHPEYAAYVANSGRFLPGLGVGSAPVSGGMP